jgi:hypothetical protein
MSDALMLKPPAYKGLREVALTAEGTQIFGADANVLTQPGVNLGWSKPTVCIVDDIFDRH